MPSNSGILILPLSFNLPVKLVYFLRPSRSGISTHRRVSFFFPYLSRFCLPFTSVKGIQLQLHLRDACKLNGFQWYSPLVETAGQTVKGIAVAWVELGWMSRQRALVTELYSATVAEEENTSIT